jgi:hypothetical protein
MRLRIDAKPEHSLPKTQRRQRATLPICVRPAQVRFARRNYSVFDVDQMRRLAKALSCKVGRSSALVLYPATSQNRCQRGTQGLEELRSKSAKDRSQYANDQTAI